MSMSSTSTATATGAITGPLPRFEVELRDASDAVVIRGLAISMHGTDGPTPSIRYDGGVYINSGEVVGSGHEPTRHVYRWAPHGQIDMTDAPPDPDHDPDPGAPAH